METESCVLEQVHKGVVKGVLWAAPVYMFHVSMFLVSMPAAFLSF